jgi:hypothetical protein
VEDGRQGKHERRRKQWTGESETKKALKIRIYFTIF